MRGYDGVGADRAGGDLVGNRPHCSLKGGAARGGDERRWEGDFSGWHCCGFAGLGSCSNSCGAFSSGFGHGGGHFSSFLFPFHVLEFGMAMDSGVAVRAAFCRDGSRQLKFGLSRVLKLCMRFLEAEFARS